MASLVINVKHMKKCAFCKNWFDPTCSAITPEAPTIGLWKIKDINQKCKCLKKNIDMPANAFCSNDFESKL